MCQNYIDEMELLKRDLEQSQIAYNVLLSSQTSYIGRLWDEIHKLRIALAIVQQNQTL